MKRSTLVAALLLISLSGTALAAKMICTGQNCRIYPDGTYTCENVRCTYYP